MNDRTRLPAITLSIAAVERDTGLGKDTLRVWERRYGFPTPSRDAVGERAYTLDQVDKLRVLKRLLDAGHRPGRIVGLSFDLLRALGDADSAVRAPGADTAPEPADAAPAAAAVHGLLGLARRHDSPGLKAELARLLGSAGVARFVIDIIAPLNAAVGDAWLRGQLEIFEEHIVTEASQVALRQAIGSLPEAPATARPRVLLTTFPGEPHGLGLLMAEAMLAVDGCACISLGVQTPLWDIALAASACRADIVALGFSGCVNPNRVVDGLAELRAKLPVSVAIWAGGAAPVLHRRRVAGVQPMATLEQLPGALVAWRHALQG